jgi:hypothetical protein
MEAEADEVAVGGTAVAGALPPPPPLPPQTQLKRGHLAFVRGPLPRGFASQLHSPWKLMGWW